MFRVLTHIKSLVSSCFYLFQRCLLKRARPHQGIHQQVPQGEVTTVPPDQRSDRIISVPILSHSSNKIEEIKSKPIHFANGCAK